MPVDLDYLDTSALMRFVGSDVAAASPRDVHGATAVQALLDDTGHIVAVCSLAIVEVRAAISRDWRMSNAEKAQFDGAWAARANLRVMQLVADQDVVLLGIPPRAAEHAATLVHLASEEHQIALGTWDAIHLITASRWAYDSGELVRLHTTDDGFARFVNHYPEFAQFVEVVDLNPPTP
jgi:hypothetical protein